ncbi:MAG TPA: HAMP domain-containing sensor histidine kinase [Gaiellaceae bacterium]|jgi:signal transduction histidine kinase|nr:HAMP domain-containing sensor histidine kinase [Gaiellaceae bacterium]
MFFRSLRFRLPALFLLGILLAAVVATLIAVRFFQSYTRTHAASELRREAAGIVTLYEGQAGVGHVSPGNLQLALGGDRIYWVPAVAGASLLAGPVPQLPRSEVPLARVVHRSSPAFDLDVQGSTYLGVGQVVRLAGIPVGALVVAKPESALRSRWLQLVWRLAIAFGIGIPVALALVVFFSLRIVRPIEALTEAADEVAEGHYGVELPEQTGGSEVARLSARFGEMAVRLAESEALTRNFLMSVSHELRTPLTAIRGHVAALREGVVEGEDARERSLEVIAEEGQRLERLVGDVLDLAKLDARRFALLREEVDMRALCERAYDTFAEEARARDIDYELELGEGAVLVTDGDRVLQIVTNLVANALRWTPPGGRVDLALARRNGEVTVTVSDTGPGIAPDEEERIFRPFWSGDGGGTGLGLPIARELAFALGGRLELQSEAGEGSRFVLVLPVQVSQPA